MTSFRFCDFQLVVQRDAPPSGVACSVHALSAHPLRWSCSECPLSPVRHALSVDSLRCANVPQPHSEPGAPGGAQRVMHRRECDSDVAHLSARVWALTTYRTRKEQALRAGAPGGTQRVMHRRECHSERDATGGSGACRTGRCGHSV